MELWDTIKRAAPSILVDGFDPPAMMMRATKSVSPHQQKFGRALRPTPPWGAQRASTIIAALIPWAMAGGMPAAELKAAEAFIGESVA